MIQTPTAANTSATRAPLCPNCGSARVRITTSILAHYDVVYESVAEDFRVIDELLGDAMWDADTGVACAACSWRGTVRDLGGEADRHER